MSSRILPKEQSGQAKAFLYHSVSQGVVTPAASAPPVGNQQEDVHRERDRLRARVTELEQALVQQSAASRQAGFREGEASGRNQAEAAVKPVMDRLCRSVQEMVECKPRLRKEIEEDAVQLSLAIARRILRREVCVDPAALQGLLQAGFDRLGRADLTRIIVHPEHVGPVREALVPFTTRQVEVFGDVSREKGTLIFETTRGSLDASIDSQLREIELGLTDRLKSR